MLIPADSAVQAWLQTLTAWPVPLGVAAGVRMAASTTVVMLVLELLCLDVAIGLARKSPSLYAQAWAATLRNNFLLGPAVYYVAQEFFCWPALPPASSAVAAVALVLVHAAGYYTAHRLMHTKALYWAHSFHHQFSTHVVPSASNAVSLTEYAIAYMLPFVVGCVVCRPDALALYAAVSLISANNLLIHTPRLEALAAALLPSVFVSTGGRLAQRREAGKKRRSGATVNRRPPGAPPQADEELRCAYAEPRPAARRLAHADEGGGRLLPRPRGQAGGREQQGRLIRPQCRRSRPLSLYSYQASRLGLASAPSPAPLRATDKKERKHTHQTSKCSRRGMGGGQGPYLHEH